MSSFDRSNEAVSGCVVSLDTVVLYVNGDAYLARPLELTACTSLLQTSLVLQASSHTNVESTWYIDIPVISLIALCK